LWIFWQHVLLCVVVAVLTWLATERLYTFATPNFLLWAAKAALTMLTSAALTALLYEVFFHKDVRLLIRKVKAMLRERLSRVRKTAK
jgi:hypothetical protein